MEDLGMFLQMGGYGGFIWAAYGISLFVVVVLIVSSMTSLRRAQRVLRALKGPRGSAG